MMSDSWLKVSPDSPGLPTALLVGSTDAASVSELLGIETVWWADGVARSMAGCITDAVPDLGSNPALMRVLHLGSMSAVMRSILVLHGSAEGLLTAEALEATRDLARRGMPLSGILRGIRVGHTCMADAFLEVLEKTGDEASRAGEMRRVVKVLLEQHDAFLTAIEAEYRQEHKHGGAASAAARLQTISKVISGDMGAAQASYTLGYPIDHRHLGLVAWTQDERGAGADDVVHEAATAVLKAAGCIRFLFVPVGAGALWAWGSLPDTRRMPDVRRAALPPQVEVVVGEVGNGIDGFRSTHAEARAVERLLRLGSRTHGNPVTLHEDIALVVLLAEDLDAARTFLRRTLGALCSQDTRTREARETLRCYLDERRSLATAAARMQVARNTVAYRVRRAEELCGKSVNDHHLVLHAALLLHDYVTAAPVRSEDGCQ